MHQVKKPFNAVPSHCIMPEGDQPRHPAVTPNPQTGSSRYCIHARFFIPTITIKEHKGVVHKFVSCRQAGYSVFRRMVKMGMGGWVCTAGPGDRSECEVSTSGGSHTKQGFLGFSIIKHMNSRHRWPRSSFSIPSARLSTQTQTAATHFFSQST
jgi:hypothetical protein